ncbi:hypothetical protein Lepto7376_2098 [[Leptolyngbya] sp. PCC 7376]|uniref:hypothetical protein n=1 Tax=[Leptolyngbya] sp. PCC 7376 TaxID=111781 RepID=UPI00029F1E30|nr:hypothetical protein [[Leptolyngbya] sp. PCC 7376]AFY38396.1 hypothetical protein Lepto7376_2098 [[Leptolyngbya] sp. PCC 7376]
MRLNLSSRFTVVFVTLATAIALVGCGGSEPEESALDSETSTPAIQGEPLETSPDTKTEDKLALNAGAYCYRTDEPTLQATAEFLVEPDNSVTGTLEATVTDDANAYYTSYEQTFAGVLEGDTFEAAITTKIEDDLQQSKETWTLDQKQLSSDSAIFLKRVDCEEIIALKATEKAPPKAVPTQVPTPTPKPQAAAPTPSAPLTTSTPSPQAPAPSTSPIRVAFNSGSTESVVKGSLAADQKQVYLINAQEGQEMYLEITNGSGAAIFDVEVDNGEVIQEDLPEFIEFTSPFSGDYIVTVKGQENNSNYALSITIQ